MSDAATAIVWFRRDLRLTDNPALAAACARARHVVALYVHAPDEDGEWSPGGASPEPQPAEEDSRPVWSWLPNSWR